MSMTVIQKKKIETIEPTVKISKLNNSDSNINCSEIYNVLKFSKNLSTSDFNNDTKTNEINNKKIELSENCIIADINKVSNEKENIKQTLSLDDTLNCISKNKIITRLDRCVLPIIVNSRFNNTHFLSVKYDDT